DGGPAVNAMLGSWIPDLALDAAGNLYIVDHMNFRVRRVDAASGRITTVAGNGDPGFSGDGGPATSAGMSPWSVAIDALGKLLIGDNNFDIFGGPRLRVVEAATGNIHTLAGGGGATFSFDGDPFVAFQGARVRVGPSGRIFIEDRGVIRMLQPRGATE